MTLHDDGVAFLRSGWRGKRFVVATAAPRPADLVLLAEFLAVRTILLNLHFAAAVGDTPTAEAMKRLIQRADAEKVRKAQERLASVSPRRTS